MSKYPVQEPDTSFADLLSTLVVHSVQLPMRQSSPHDLAINFNDDDTCITASQAPDIVNLLTTTLVLPSLAHDNLASTAPQLLVPPHNPVTSLVCHQCPERRALQLQEKLQELLPTALVRVSTLSQDPNLAFEAFRIVIGPSFSDNGAECPTAANMGKVALPPAPRLVMQSPVLSNFAVDVATPTIQNVSVATSMADASPEEALLSPTPTPSNNSPISDRSDISTQRGNLSPSISIYPVAEKIQPLSTDRMPSGMLHLSTDGSERLRNVLHATITALYHGNGTSARIVLYPESLGTIVVYLQLHNATATVQITVSSPQTFGLVEQTIEMLRADLRQSGIPAEAIAVRLQQEHSTEQQMPSIPGPTAIVAPVGNDDNPERRQKRRQHMYRQRYTHNTNGHFEHFM